MKLRLNGIEIPGVTIIEYSCGDTYKYTCLGLSLRTLNLSVTAYMAATSADAKHKQELIWFFADHQVKEIPVSGSGSTSCSSIDFDIRALAHPIIEGRLDDEYLELISVPIDSDHFNAGLKSAPEWRSLLNNCGGDF